MKQDSYWLDLAVEEFHRTVWLESLQKFALDTDSDREEFKYGDYCIEVTFPENSDRVLVTLSSPTIKVILSYSLCFPDLPPKVQSCPNPSEGVTATEDICELWKQQFFKLL